MAEPSVLVIIPSYNHGRFIAARVQSVLDQQGAGSEFSLDVRLIDDASTDNTMTVLESFRHPSLSVSQRPLNSGSPFTAWLQACEILETERFDFIWMAESDDVADPHFLSKAIAKLHGHDEAVLYYSHSWFIDQRDLIIGHSINYLKRQFPAGQWTQPVCIPGTDFLQTFLLHGMAIPNMSSALMRADSFRRAVKSDFCRFRLAADWLFAIAISQLGAIYFDPWDGNMFRHHLRTARSEADWARVVVEHMAATTAAFGTGLCQPSDYKQEMDVWVQCYRHERVIRSDFIRIANSIVPELLPDFLTHIDGKSN